MASALNVIANPVIGRRCQRLVALVAVVVAAHAVAQSGPELEKAKGCPACHAPATKKIGPAYAEIAARYRGDAGAAERLVTVLKEGRRHPRAAATDAELRSLVGYILSVR